MVQNANKYLFLLLALLGIFQVGFSQKIQSVDNAATEKFFGPVHKEFLNTGVPETEICGDYTTVILHYRNHKMLDSVEFLRNPIFLKSAFAGVTKYYKKANWKKILPDSGANFDLVQPVVYQYDHHIQCPDSIQFSKIREMTQEDIDNRKDKSLPVYILKIFKTVKFEPVH